MKIQRKGRTYSDTPTQQVLDGEGGRDNYSINRVELRCYFRDLRCFTNSRPLMDYLDRMQAVLAEMTIGGEEVPAQYHDALTQYLSACRGLESFRRDRISWHTRADLMSLLLQVGFPPEYVSRITPVQIQDGPSNSRRNRKDSRLS
jgi:hypothetical protein